MEVVGHHIVKINIGINPWKIQIGKLVCPPSSGNRNLIIFTC